MLPNCSLISCNFSSFPSLSLKNPNLRIPLKSLPNSQNPIPRIPFLKTTNPTISLKPALSPFGRQGLLQICQSSFNSQDSKDPILKEGDSGEDQSGNGNYGGDGRDWTTSILLFVLWAALMYYVFMLTPNQTPFRDMYFLQKLLNLRGDDGFRMNEVLVSLWYIMGLWPLVYSMLMLPTGRSSRSNIPVWPFLVLSCFGGAYVLLPYFVIWRPPPPPVEEAELGKWPLSFLESKITAGILFAAGLGIITYASVANGDVWKEFYQYFRESKFIHVTCIDFTLLSTFAPFWVYNDMTARKWYDKGSWLLPLALIPFLGPALYLVLRPSLSAMPVSLTSTTNEQE
ncbi:hypothetical protein HHK36_003417 [Tetracentron sinense]|uniref:Cardiolipin synthase N-terminal domain-containing protein n=1 Tax=Tetracentron sinense TaxID=13715 RepID=A0A834ZSH1_TETSI|nr:hypothetical protein HHK36_003417 [Tetracentron sinense]